MFLFFIFFATPVPMIATSLLAKQMNDASRAILWGLQRITPSSTSMAGSMRKTGLAAIFSTVLGAGLFAAGALPTDAHAVRLLDEILAEQRLSPISSPALDALRSSTGDVTERNLTVMTGDTLFSIYGKLGAKDPEVLKYIRSKRDFRPLVMPQPGQFITAGLYEDGRISYLRMYLEGPHARDSRVIEIVRNGQKLAGTNQPFVFDVIEETASGHFSGSLARTAENLDIPQHVLSQLDNVWEANRSPLPKLKKGDLVQVAYERKYANGHFIRNGQLLAVRISRAGKVTEAFWHPELKSFYTETGSSVKQTFLRVPLDVKEVSSEFAPLRRHPVTGKLRPHNGTDFRAPKGSRIFAASEGEVTFVGFQKRGYGRYVKISHGQNRETVYAHMSAVASGLKVGQKVQKGQVIGYVGRTGLATGNHLHYELVIDGVQVNPLTADLPDTDNLTPVQLARLKTVSQPLLDRFTVLAKEDSNSRNPRASQAGLSETARASLGFRSSFPARSILRMNLAQKNAQQMDSTVR